MDCCESCSHRLTITVTYLAVSLNTGNLHGDAFLNCFLSALVEIPAYVLSWVFFRWCSRRVTVFSTLCMAGIFLLIIQLIPEGMGRNAILKIYHDTTVNIVVMDIFYFLYLLFYFKKVKFVRLFNPNKSSGLCSFSTNFLCSLDAIFLSFLSLYLLYIHSNDIMFHSL